MEPRVFFREAFGQGVIYHGQCSFLAAPYPSYSLVVRPLFAPFPVLFQSGGAVLLQRGSGAVPERGGSAAPEGAQCCSREGVQCSFRGGLVLLQREAQCCSRGRPVLLQGNGSTSGTQWTAPVPIQPCPLLRGYVLTQAIDIFHVLYLLYLLWLRQSARSASAPVGGGGKWRERPPCFVSRSALAPRCNGHCGVRSSTPHGEVAPAK